MAFFQEKGFLKVLYEYFMSLSMAFNKLDYFL